MTIKDIKYLRLHNQLISGHDFSTAGEVVATLGAIQAQDYAGAKWSIGLRMPKATDAGIEQAIMDKEIVRTWGLRGTLHFLAPTDIHWILGLLAPRFGGVYAGHYKKLGLDAPVLKKAYGIMEKALRDGKQLTRKELAAILEKKGLATHDMRMNFMLVKASMDKLICFGGRRGKEFTHTLLDEWVPATKPMKREEALAALAERFFASHGPATLKDFAWWSGLTLKDVKEAADLIAPSYKQETVEGNVYVLPKNMPAVKKKSAVYMLPGFDEYMLGYADRTVVIDEKYLKSIAGPNGLFNATIVVNGQVEGSWRRTITKNGLIIETKFFQKEAERHQTAAHTALKRYGKFMELPLTVRS